MDNLSKIVSLRKQLLTLGYHEFQLDNIFKETVNTTRIEHLTEEQSLQLVHKLEYYINFALKCRVQRKGKN